MRTLARPFANKLLPSLLIALSLGVTISQTVFGHDDAHHAHDLDNMSGPRGIINFNWPAKHIHRAFTAGYPDTFGISSFFRRISPKQYSYKGKQCIQANFVAFNISDDYAHNIDETVELELIFDSSKTEDVLYAFDANGASDAGGKITTSDKNNKDFYSTTINLPRARFANRGMDGADLALAAAGTFEEEAQNQISSFGLCGISIKRSYQTKPEAKLAHLQLHWRDNKQATAVRFGLYDSSGRAVLPSDDAINIQYYETTRKQLSLQNYNPRSQPWPHANRYFSYANGDYTVDLPAGTYTLVTSKGPEYRLLQQSIEVKGQQKNTATINLQRWDNLPSKGWHAGDVHIHMSRKPADNTSIMALLQAEDIHISNLLLMSNAGAGHFEQYAYGKAGKYQKDEHSIIPGIEGPRTAQRGHAIALNIEEPILDQNSYFLYHQFMQAYHQQNALNGYAHVGSEEFNASWGLALDVPFGLVDFVEIMQNSALRTEFWYEFLNLGYALAPAAGSDFPYFDQPGAVRSYAYTGSKQTEKPSAQAWFDAVKAGNTYVSNSPILSFSINEAGMGDHLPLAKNTHLTINASVKINPDLDQIKTLELVRCGEVIKRIEAEGNSQTLNLSMNLPAQESQWLAVRAYGVNYAMAHSGAIYIEDEAGSSACKNKVASIAKTMKLRLDALNTTPINIQRELEYWETANMKKQYEQQLPQLKHRIEAAKSIYDKLIAM